MLTPSVHPQLMDRRSFLAGGAAGMGVLAAGLLGAGCNSTATGPAFTVLDDTVALFSGIDQRIAVALASTHGDPIHPAGPVTLQIGPAGGVLGPPMTAAVHGDGLPNAYLLARHRFDGPGTYTIRATYKHAHAELPVQVMLPSTSQIPVAGRPLISVPTPTVADPKGVNPVCTAQPPCPFHQRSLDEALAQSRPIALLFATPALCQSRFCGPVLANLVAAHQPFVTRVQFIHCEIYTDLSGQTSTAPVTAYHLDHEPVLLLAGPDGVVRERIDNAFDRVEAADALGRLVS